MVDTGKIYLIGSFHGFRDKIIDALPTHAFADPRKHHQSSVARLVVDDLREAEECEIALAVFPEGKDRGTMSYVEIGVAVTHGNHVFVVDEAVVDPVLAALSDTHFTNLDDAIQHLKQNSIVGNGRTPVVSKYPLGYGGEVPVNNVLIAGVRTPELSAAVRRAQRERPDRNFQISTNAHDDLKHMNEVDLFIPYFPASYDWDRHACLLMGGAYARDISSFIVDGHDPVYPPLQAAARRHGSLETAVKYMTRVDNLHISQESKVMYELFREDLTRNL